MRDASALKERSYSLRYLKNEFLDKTRQRVATGRLGVILEQIACSCGGRISVESSSIVATFCLGYVMGPDQIWMTVSQ